MCPIENLAHETFRYRFGRNECDYRVDILTKLFLHGIAVDEVDITGPPFGKRSRGTGDGIAVRKVVRLEGSIRFMGEDLVLLLPDVEDVIASFSPCESKRWRFLGETDSEQVVQIILRGPVAEAQADRTAMTDVELITNRKRRWPIGASNIDLAAARLVRHLAEGMTVMLRLEDALTSFDGWLHSYLQALRDTAESHSSNMGIDEVLDQVIEDADKNIYGPLATRARTMYVEALELVRRFSLTELVPCLLLQVMTQLEQSNLHLRYPCGVGGYYGALDWLNEDGTAYDTLRVLHEAFQELVTFQGELPRADWGNDV